MTQSKTYLGGVSEAPVEAYKCSKERGIIRYAVLSTTS